MSVMPIKVSGGKFFWFGQSNIYFKVATAWAQISSFKLSGSRTSAQDPVFDLLGPGHYGFKN
jgi:hypothetical protein